MQKFILFLSFLLSFIQFSLISKENENKNRLLFQPLLANPFESRVGSMYQAKEEKLRLDIGASIDLVRIQTVNDNELSFGSDFMVYTRLRHDGRLKFPVETADYFFGINSAYSTKVNDLPLNMRLRIAHISSHIVDGMADSLTLRDLPFVFSREFFDFVTALNINDFRLYAGATLIFSTIPKDVLRFNPQFGIEYKKSVFKDIDILCAYDLKLVGYDSKSFGQNALQLGFLFNTFNKNGLFTGIYYYSGKSIHGMYYKEYDEYLGLGFQLFFY